MRSEDEHNAALRLVHGRFGDTEISRRLDIPRGTVNTWRRAKEVDSGGRTPAWTGTSGPAAGVCFRCAGAPLTDPRAYSYLLGMYLGDGTLARVPRGVFSLRISCDLKYPDIVDEVATAIAIVKGTETIGFVLRPGCVVVNSYWKHWPCHFPQHGPGRKHERPIVLAPWQDRLVRDLPEELLRGLIHSDGNRHINEVARPLRAGVKRYRYPRYMFTNASEDILGICADALDRLGIGWTRTNTRVIAVSRREDVARLDEFVGPKR